MSKPTTTKVDEPLKNVWVRESVHRALKCIASRTDKKIGELVEELLQPHVASEIRLLAKTGGKA